MAQTNGERLAEIASVFAKYGFNHMYKKYVRSEDRKADAVHLRKVFEELGPSFIKIGQILSTRHDLLSEDYINELQKLQDDTPKFPFDEVRRIFLEDFGATVEDSFAWFDEEPFASASIAQVHRATLLTGEEVIIKVQRPDIEQTLIRDIRLLSRIIGISPKNITETFIDTKAALNEIRLSTALELDFKHEAHAMIKFRRNNADSDVVRVPKPFMEYVSKRILVQEFVDGIQSLNKEELLKKDYVLEDIGEKLVYSFLTQVFRDGFYHGDPHPGNIIIKGRHIYFIDFGIYGELSNSNKRHLIQLARYVYTQDINNLMKILLQVAETKGRVDQRKLYDDIDYLFSQYLSRSFADLELDKIIDDVLQVARAHGMSMPHDFILLFRAFGIMEGVVTDLTPETNVMEIVNTFVRNQGDIDWIEMPTKETLLVHGYETLLSLSSLPRDVQDLIDNLNSGRTKVNVGLADDDNRWKEINQMINRIIFAIIIAAIILASAVIITANTGTGISIFAIIVFIVAGTMGLWLIISIIRSGML